MIGIFGGSGFIGRNFTRHAETIGLDIVSFDRAEAVNGNEIAIDFMDPVTYKDHLNKLTMAVLLVSASVPGTYADNMPGEVENNILPYSRFLKAINNTNIKHVVFLSSGGTIYGATSQKYIRETHPTAPINPYGCGKLMIEKMLQYHSHHAPWSYTILRPSNPVGLGQSPAKGQGLVAAAVYAALNGKTMEIWGDGSVVRDYFDVRDLCSAIELSLTNSNARDEIFNVGASKGYSVNQLLDEVETVLGMPIKRSYCTGRAIDVGRNVLDTAKIEASLGWQRSYYLSDTIGTLV